MKSSSWESILRPKTTIKLTVLLQFINLRSKTVQRRLVYRTIRLRSIECSIERSIEWNALAPEYMESEDTEKPKCSTDQELQTATRRWRDEVQEWWFEGDSAAFDKEIRGWSELCGWKCVTFHMNPGYVRREIEKEQEEDFHNVLMRFVTSLFVPRRPRPDVGEQLNELHRKVDLLLDSALFGAAHRGHVQQGTDAGVRALLELEDTARGATLSAKVLQNAVKVIDAGVHVLPSAANTEVGAVTSATGFSSTTTNENPRKALVAAGKTSQPRSRKLDKQQNSK